MLRPYRMLALWMRLLLLASIGSTSIWLAALPASFQYSRDGFWMGVDHGEISLLLGQFKTRDRGFFEMRSDVVSQPTYGFAIPMFDFGVFNGIRVRVPTGSVALLLAVFSVVMLRTRSGRVIRVGFCRNCGYCLTGNTSGVCPECGVAMGG